MSDRFLIEGIRTSKTSYIEIVGIGEYDEQAIQHVIDVLKFGLERGAYSAQPEQEEKI